MITFKQFLTEKVPMHRGAFAQVQGRLENDARIGFEIEVFVPENSMYFAGPQSEPPNIAQVKHMDSHSVIEFFDVNRGQIDKDYGAWLAEQEDQFIESNWEQYDDDERIGRREAQRDFDASKYDFETWFNESFKSALHFVHDYGLEPKYAWYQDGISVYTSASSAEYMDGWNDTATSVAKGLHLTVGGRVRVQGKGYDSWNITHDSSIKDNDGVDYENGMKGYGLEIVSPPLPLKEAFKKLSQVLVWCDRNEITTNESTGLHVNISLNDMRDFDPLKLILFMGDKHVLSQFGRSANNFARSQLQVVIDSVQATGKLPKDAKELEDLAREGLKHTTKWFSVNLEHLPKYLEFRALGGANYHKRLDEIQDVIGRWLTAVELASDPNKERQLYLKKLANLKNTIPGDGDTLGASVRAAKAKAAEVT